MGTHRSPVMGRGGDIGSKDAQKKNAGASNEGRKWVKRPSLSLPPLISLSLSKQNKKGTISLYSLENAPNPTNPHNPRSPAARADEAVWVSVILPGMYSRIRESCGARRELVGGGKR